MSKYTTELRYICETLAGDKESSGYGKVNDIIEKARQKIFDFDYPIFDPEYKKPLETKIIKHFYFNEIGLETYGQFKLFLDARMNEIMPYYNQLYKSEMIKFDPLTDFDYQVTGDKTGTGTKNNKFERYNDKTRNSKVNDSDTVTTNETSNQDTTGHVQSDTNTTDTKMDLYHDTPQGSISTLDDSSYLTNARKITDNNDVGYQGDSTENRSGTNNTTSTREHNITNEDAEKGHESETGSGEFKNVDEYAEHHFGKGNGKSFSEMLQDFRKTFLNIDAMIIANLEDLFMGLWDSAL